MLYDTGIEGAWHFSFLNRYCFNVSRWLWPIFRIKARKRNICSWVCWVAIAFSNVILMAATLGFLNKYYQQKFVRNSHNSCRVWNYMQYLGLQLQLLDMWMSAEHRAHTFGCFWSAVCHYQAPLVISAVVRMRGGLLWHDRLSCSSSIDNSCSQTMYNSLSISMSLIHAHLGGCAIDNNRVTTVEYWPKLSVSHWSFISQ
jgi:hypothetical protein